MELRPLHLGPWVVCEGTPRPIAGTSAMVLPQACLELSWHLVEFLPKLNTAFLALTPPEYPSVGKGPHDAKMRLPRHPEETQRPWRSAGEEGESGPDVPTQSLCSPASMTVGNWKLCGSVLVGKSELIHLLLLLEVSTSPVPVSRMGRKCLCPGVGSQVSRPQLPESLPRAPEELCLLCK